VLRSRRPRLRQRRSSRSSQSRSPSPWNLFSSKCHTDESFGIARGGSRLQDEIQIRGSVYSGNNNVFDNSRVEERDVSRDDSAWEVLSDRRASFETLGTNGRPEDVDEATQLGRSIPGAYSRHVAGPTREERCQTLKSWKSADNGAAGKRGWTSRYEEDRMQEFGSQRGHNGEQARALSPAIRYYHRCKRLS
jgi:hypothetical protein